VTVTNIDEDDRVAVCFPTAQLRGTIVFPPPSSVNIPFLLSGRQHQLGIDLDAGTFWFDANERP
jgi:hypothetical protein